MCDVGGKLLSEIKSMYVDSLACVRVKRVGVSISGNTVVSDRSESCPLGSSMYLWTQ